MIEELVAFTSTHLAMVTFLMPWKKIVETNIVTTNVTTTKLFSLFDMMEVDKWYYKMSTTVPPVPLDDESLTTMVTTIICLAIISLLFSIVSFGLRTFYPAIDPNIHSIVDFTSWGTVLALLVVSLISQGDFDASWAFGYRAGLGLDHTADTDKMFLSVGVIVIHLLMLSYFVGKDIMDRIKE